MDSRWGSWTREVGPNDPNRPGTIAEDNGLTCSLVWHCVCFSPGVSQLRYGSTNLNPRRNIMKRSLPLALVVLLFGSILASASTLITKQQAEQDALNAVGGGTVALVLKEKELGKIIWSVDVIGATQEYEVW